MSIDSFTIDYDAINPPNIFTNGDSVTGRITVVVSGQSKIQSISFTALGKATVCWAEHYGQYTTIVYRATEKYYKLEHIILEGPKNLNPGRHVFPFTFNIPDRDMPSTIKAKKGKVKYSLEAKLSRSMVMAKTAKTKFTFVSKADMAYPKLLEPQNGNKERDVVFFASGNITLNVFIEKMGYQQGEAMNVIVEVTNSSTRTTKPKFVFYEKKSFFAQGQRRVDTKNILKDKAEPVGSCERTTVSKLITIPEQLLPSILNCSILKLEYRLKVILDVALTKNPEIKLPIIVLPNFNWSSSNEKGKAYWNI